MFSSPSAARAVEVALPVTYTLPEGVAVRSNSSSLPCARPAGLLRPLAFSICSALTRETVAVFRAAAALRAFEALGAGSMNVTPPSASALSWNGQAFVVAISRVLPSSTVTTWLPAAATMPWSVGTAEVTCPVTVCLVATFPVLASTVISRVWFFADRSSVSAVNTASSPWPQPGEK